MEYLYLNIHTGAYWTSTRNGKANPDDWEKNNWEKPVFRVTVHDCQLTADKRARLSYDGFWSEPHVSYMREGWLIMSEKHRDRFRIMEKDGMGRRFGKPIDRSFPLLHYLFIEPLDGTRMPEPGEILDIIPEGTNVERFL